MLRFKFQIKFIYTTVQPLVIKSKQLFNIFHVSSTSAAFIIGP